MRRRIQPSSLRLNLASMRILLVVAIFGLSVFGIGYQVKIAGSQEVLLAVSQVNVASVTSTTASITWSTNKPTSGNKVNYGLSNRYGSEATNPLEGPDETSHSVTIVGLEPATTYHYQVESSTATETARSISDRTFTTSSGAGGGGAPRIVFGPKHDVVSDRATIIFRTDVETAALVEYNTLPDQPPGPAIACNPLAPSPCPPVWDDPKQEFSTDHSVNLTGLTEPLREYRYKIKIVNRVGSILVTSEIKFKTSASPIDHVFSTGGCNDGTEIGKCNAEGKYCRSGGGDPVYDCRPDIPCPRSCGAGATCQPSGDCSLDPQLGTAPTQCNPQKCYQKCDAKSGPLSGNECTNDSQCEAPGFKGRCITGGFNVPAVAGCYASWPQCNANTILKVRPDRVCDKWYTCKTSVPITDSQGRTENQCFNLTICDSLSQSGQCNSVLEGRQCSNDPLRFCTRDEDCLGAGAVCLPAGTNATLTFPTPENVSQIQNLSGNAYAGLDWHNQAGAPRIEGFHPLSVAKQVGTKVEIRNGDFEQVGLSGRCRKDPATQCSSDAECRPAVGEDNGPCEFSRDINRPINLYWEPITPTGSSGSASVTGIDEGTRNNPNVVMRITPTDKAGSGAWTKYPEVGLLTTRGAQYILSVTMKSDQPGGQCVGGDNNSKPCSDDTFCPGGTCGGQRIKIALVNSAGTERVFGEKVLSKGWQSFQLGPIDGPGGPTHLTFTTTADTDPISFFIDDVSMLPALQVAPAELKTQACRLYPREDSPSCDYLDRTGIFYHGLKGFCLERDPRNTAVCLNWWPVDILQGENIFGEDQDLKAGYAGRRPLFACAEAGSNPITVIAGQGFARSEPDGLFVTHNAAPDACNNDDSDRCKSVSPAQNGVDGNFYDLRGFNIRWGDVDFVRIFYTAGDDDFDQALTRSALLRDNARGEKLGPAPGKEGSLYVFDLFPASGTESTRTVQHAPYFSTLKYVEQNLPGTNRPPGGWSEGSGEDDFEKSAYALGDDAIRWKKRCTREATGNNEDENGFGARVWTSGSNPEADILTFISICAYDDSGGDLKPGWSVQVHLKAYCNKLAQVATLTDDKAWAERTAEQSDFSVLDLNYRYVSDLAPFAGSVAPNLNDPGAWPPRALRVESADINRSPPFQARGGGPYACGSSCTAHCDGNSGFKTGLPCFDSSDCNDADNNKQGICVGTGVCALYNSANKIFVPKFPRQTCTQTSECDPPGKDPHDGQECIGGGAINRGTQTFDNTSTFDNAHFAQYRLQRLFAEAVGLWQWDTASQKYVPDSSTPWEPPTKECKACAGGANGSLACSGDGQCAGAQCLPTDKHPKANAPGETAADYCSIKPTITNIVDGGKDVQIGEGEMFILKFNSIVDAEQRPLKWARIDWGDGAENQLIDGPLSRAPKDDPNNPEAYSHNYECTNPAGCTYQIRIQIEDNWRWCSDGSHGTKATPCNQNPSDPSFPWAVGPLVRVTPS